MSNSPTPKPEITIDRTKKLPECERGECARCPRKRETRTPVVIVKKGKPNRVAQDRRIEMCTCGCHAR